MDRRSYIRYFLDYISSSFESLFIRPVLELRVFGVGSHQNPLKGKPRWPVLSERKRRDVERAICDFVSYNAEDTPSVTNFETVKQNTDCIFAKKARVWGSIAWDPSISLEENIHRSLPMFLKFTLVCQDLGLDMFLFELPGDQFGKDINPDVSPSSKTQAIMTTLTPVKYLTEIFADAVRRVLKVVSDKDPTGWRSMDKPYIHRKGWVFEFNKVTFFITTFAPFYPPNNSRYNFQCDNCYISFQPEISFAQHDLPPDTPNTEWECPITVRDRIRVAFRKSGREYMIRDTIYYPMAEDIVKPEKEEDPVVEWWKSPQTSDDKIS